MERRKKSTRTVLVIDRDLILCFVNPTAVPIKERNVGSSARIPPQTHYLMIPRMSQIGL